MQLDSSETKFETTPIVPNQFHRVFERINEHLPGLPCFEEELENAEFHFQLDLDARRNVKSFCALAKNFGDAFAVLVREQVHPSRVALLGHDADVRL